MGSPRKQTITALFSPSPGESLLSQWEPRGTTPVLGERDDCQKTIAQPWGVFTLSGQFLFINTYNSSPVTKFGTKHLVWTPKDIQITILSEYAVSQRVAEQCRLTLHKRTKWLYSTAVLKRQMSMPSIVNIKTSLDQPHVWVPDQGIVLV